MTLQDLGALGDLIGGRARRSPPAIAPPRHDELEDYRLRPAAE